MHESQIQSVITSYYCIVLNRVDMSQPSSNALEKYVGRSTSTSKTTFVLNRLITVCVIRSLFKVTVLFTGKIFLVMFIDLHGKKEDETKLISLPTFLWKHENVVLDGTSDPSAVVSDSV